MCTWMQIPPASRSTPAAAHPGRPETGSWEWCAPVHWLFLGQLKSSIKHFFLVIFFQFLLTLWRFMIWFSTVRCQGRGGRTVVSILTDFPFHGFLYELQNFQRQSFEFVLIFLIKFHLQLQQKRQAVFRCIWCDQCYRMGKVPHQAGGELTRHFCTIQDRIPFFHVLAPHIHSAYQFPCSHCKAGGTCSHKAGFGYHPWVPKSFKYMWI